MSEDRQAYEVSVEPSWRSIDLVYIRVVAPAKTIANFRRWLQSKRITFVHSETRHDQIHAGYYRAGHRAEICAWLEKNVGLASTP